MLNGFLVAYVGVPPILATLATYTTFLGIATGITGGASVTGFPDQMGSIGSGTIFGIPITFVIFAFIGNFDLLHSLPDDFWVQDTYAWLQPNRRQIFWLKNNLILMKLYIMVGFFLLLRRRCHELYNVS